jgi:glutaminyl-tRNA synthetase
MAVLNPLMVIIENYPEGKVEELDAENNPEDASMGSRKIPFCRTLYIEKEDFCEDPPPKYFRLAPGREVRLKHAYYIKCVDVVKNREGEVVQLRCVYDPATRGGWSADGRRVLGTLHWVAAPFALDAEVRLYERLFLKPNPEEDEDFMQSLNPESLKVLSSCKVEPTLKDAKIGERYQFLRLGYFCVDPDSSEKKLVFNRIVSLPDKWTKISKNPPPS